VAGYLRRMTAPRPEPSHYFDTDPEAHSARREVSLVLPEGRVLEFVTDRGTFSPERVDKGTRVLIAEAPPPTGEVLADLGCGWGALAVTMAVRSPSAVVWAVDVNERARMLCRENAERNEVAGRVTVVAPEEVPADLRIDTIWSNPPVRIGKTRLDALLHRWLDRLTADGSAELVVHKHLGADSLARRLRDRVHSVIRRASRGGYRVLGVGAPA